MLGRVLGFEADQVLQVLAEESTLGSHLSRRGCALAAELSQKRGAAVRSCR